MKSLASYWNWNHWLNDDLSSKNKLRTHFSLKRYRTDKTNIASKMIFNHHITMTLVFRPRISRPLVKLLIIYYVLIFVHTYMHICVHMYIDIYEGCSKCTSRLKTWKPTLTTPHPTRTPPWYHTVTPNHLWNESTSSNPMRELTKQSNFTWRMTCQGLYVCKIEVSELGLIRSSCFGWTTVRNTRLRHFLTTQAFVAWESIHQRSEILKFISDLKFWKDRRTTYSILSKKARC